MANDPARTKVNGDALDKPRIIFHVPFKLGYAISGGGIRPGKLIQSFLDIGYEVDVVSGPKAERIPAIHAIMDNLRKGVRYDFCYAETSVLPTMLTEKNMKAFYPFVDFDFFRFLKVNGIPVGLFYRDIYWKFKYYKQQYPFFERMRRLFFYHLELSYFKKLLTTIFLPSLKLARYLPDKLKNIAVECVPGHDVETEVLRTLPSHPDDLSVLYVGGISPPVYDITPLMRLGAKLPVTICCREEEWRIYRPRYEHAARNVTVRHVSGEALSKLYGAHALAAIVRAEHEYLSFASPLKLYEAIGQNIPLLVSQGTNAAFFVEENDIGWCVDNGFKDLDPAKIIREYPAKVEKLLAIKGRHHWRARAKFIRDTLL